MSLSFLQPWALLSLLTLPGLWWLERRLGRPPGHRPWSLALRLLLVGLLGLALARPRVHWRADLRSSALLVDRSDSVPDAEAARALRFAEAAAEASGPERLLALVAFGESARVERSARAGSLEPLRSPVPRGRSDLAAALRLGLALLPADSSRRLVLASDGQHNQGDLDAALALVERARVPVDILPLAAASAPKEVLVEGLDLPENSRVGQRLELTARLWARQAGPARLRLYHEGALILDRELELAAGETRLATSVTVQEPGVERFRAVLEPQADGRVENNEAEAITLVAGPPRVLVVRTDPARAAPLLAALAEGRRQADAIAPEALPGSVLGLAPYEAVVLVDTPAYRVSPAAMLAIQAAVRDLGKGLLMVGGEEGFGAGGWRGSPVEKALPVTMEVKDKERRPPIALAFVIDRSGSMAESQPGGRSKLDLAKEAVQQAAELLRPIDEVAVIAFDEGAESVWPRARHERPLELAQAVAGIGIGGGTLVQAGLERALAELAGSSAPLKHVLLLSDGWSSEGDYEALLRRLKAERITLSIVAAGQGSAPYLTQLAARGGGRYYPVQRPDQIPQVFVEETQIRLGTYVVEESFRPEPVSTSPLLAGLDPADLPPLHGYVATSARAGATVALGTHLEDPLLAHGPYGLGRSVAWTSDLKGQWARAWMGWPSLGAFLLGLVDWTLPPAEAGEGLSATLSGGAAGSRLVLSLERGLSEAAGLHVEAQLLGPDGSKRDLSLRQVAADRFEAAVPSPAQGIYLLRLLAAAEGRPPASLLLPMVVPYSPEFARPPDRPTDPRLADLAARTGGRVLSEPGQVFDRVRDARAAAELWPQLLLLAALLWPLDIASRRLRLSRTDWAALRDAAAGLRRQRAKAGPAEPLLGSLSAAKHRAGRRGAAGSPEEALAPASSPEPSRPRESQDPRDPRDPHEPRSPRDPSDPRDPRDPSDPGDPGDAPAPGHPRRPDRAPDPARVSAATVEQAEAAADGPDDTLARLRAAKRRARRP